MAIQDTVVSAVSFERQMRFFADNGYKCLSLADYRRLQAEAGSTPPGSIVLTFDDGHYSHHHLAFPILKRFGFSATFFVVSGRVDREYHLTTQQMREMISQGMEIGSHGTTHRYLPLLDPHTVEDEICRSKAELEAATGSIINYFAFPGGHHNRHALQLLVSCGYSGACSCLQGLNDQRTDNYLLRRIEIRRRLTDDDLPHLLDPFRMALYRSVDSCKNLTRQVIGIEAYVRLRQRLYHLYPFKR